MSTNPFKELVEAQIKKACGTILSSDEASCVFQVKEDQYSVTYGTPTYRVTRVGGSEVLVDIPPVPPLIIMKLGQFLRGLSKDLQV